MKIKVNNLCDFSGEIDTLYHFFITCYISKEVWKEADKIISIKCGRKITLTDRNKIVGIISSDNFQGKETVNYINRLILVCKRTISKFKCEKFGSIKILLENQLSFRGLLNI